MNKLGSQHTKGFSSSVKKYTLTFINVKMTKIFMFKATQTATGFKRKKREWILPPTKLKENVDYTKKEFISKVSMHCSIT